MSEFSFIFVFLLIGFLCIAALIIINIRDKKKVLVDEDKDFFDVFYTTKKNMLEINMPEISIKTYIFLLAIAPILLGVVFWMIFPNKTFATFLALAGVFLPDLVIKILVDSRRKRYEEHYVRALKAMASALKSGLSIQQAVQDTANNPFINEDIRAGFRQIDADIKVGISVRKAFEIYAEKADNDDARDVASAIAMQADVGGSEGKVIDSIASNIEDRLMTRKRIRAIFASTDFMVLSFDVLPFLLVVMMYVTMPQYMETIMENYLYMVLYLAIIAFTIVGSFVIRKQVRIAKGE